MQSLDLHHVGFNKTCPFFRAHTHTSLCRSVDVHVEISTEEPCTGKLLVRVHRVQLYHLGFPIGLIDPFKTGRLAGSWLIEINQSIIRGREQQWQQHPIGLTRLMNLLAYHGYCRIT